MISNDDFQKAIEFIDRSKNILVTTHTRPDGDACGAVAAMYEILSALGKKAEVVLPSEMPEWYEFLFAKKPAILGKDVSVEQLKSGEFFQADLIILIDVNSNNQLSKFTEILQENEKPVLVLDHHITNDGLGDVELIDTTAAATGIIIFDLLKYAGWKLDEKTATALFVAIATDTGWFQFGNTDSRVFSACAELMELGADSARLYNDLYRDFSAQRFRLMTVMLNTLQLHFDGRYAEQHILVGDFKRTGARRKDTENLIDECQRIGTVEAAALFVELADGRIKCSLRSKGSVDVRLIAAKFSGGGHTMASGAHLAGPMENAKELIKAEVEKQLQQPDK